MKRDRKGNIVSDNYIKGKQGWKLGPNAEYDGKPSAVLVFVLVVLVLGIIGAMWWALTL